MRKLYWLLVISVLAGMLFAVDNDQNFYNDQPTVELKPGKVKVEGEIDKNFSVDFNNIEERGAILKVSDIDFQQLPLRSVIVKESKLENDGSSSFVGTYRYDGYSLWDILNRVVEKKANVEEFPRIIDMYVEIENDKGEKVIMSWGEIFYPNDLHNIIIATKYSMILPSKIDTHWVDFPNSKLVFTDDLLSERNIENPTIIRIKSSTMSFEIDRELLFSDAVSIYNGKQELETYKEFPTGYLTREYPTIFYGRGKGIHGISTFEGIALKDLLEKHFKLSRENLRTGYFVASASDGYRVVFSYSEIFNRADQQEIILVDKKGQEKGANFGIFPACDFFSDRAIKALNGLYFINE